MQLMMKVLLIGSMGVNSCLAQPATDRPDIRKVYTGPDTPDSLAFRGYLDVVHNRVNEGAKSAEDFFLFSLGLPDTVENRAMAQAAIEVFEEAYRGIKRDILTSEIANLCIDSASTRTDDQIFVLMDAQDDREEAIVEQHYQYAIQRMDSETKNLLLYELGRFKSSFVYWTVNHKTAWEMSNSNANVREFIDVTCDDLNNEWGKL